MGKVYIAGPMTGIRDFNYPAFFAAEERFNAKAGWTAINPARNDGDTLEEAVAVAKGSQRPRAYYMRKDFALLLEADAIALLPGWRKSAGASAEVVMAEQLGLLMLDAITTHPIQPEAITEEAHRIVLGERGADYGPPTIDFARTGRMWGAILGIPDVSPALVGLCMTALKISREVNKPKRDNRVDMIGYTLTVDMIEQAQS